MTEMGLWDTLKVLMSPAPTGIEGRSNLVFAAGEPALPLTSALRETSFDQEGGRTSAPPGSRAAAPPGSRSHDVPGTGELRWHAMPAQSARCS